MSARKRFRRTRRSGISNLIGAIFFVLIVALVISILTSIFLASSGYISGIHSSNQAALQAENSLVSVTNATFGGEVASTGSSVIPVNSSATPVPLLPVSNMNFSGGMQGWYVSNSYPALVDSGSVKNALETNGSSYVDLNSTSNPDYLKQSNDGEVFTLTVKNTSPYVDDDVAKVTLLVDTYFNATTTTCSLCNLPAGWTVTVTGNNITWTTPPSGGLVPTESLSFGWFADVSPSPGSYYHTVVLYWVSSSASDTPPISYLDYGVATVNTTVAAPLPLPNPAAAYVALTPRSACGAECITPGGLTAGYDGSDVTATSSSGPGSIYVNLEPSFNGQPLPAGQELSAVTTFSTTFSLTGTDVCQLAVTFASGPCGVQTCSGSYCNMAASISSDMDGVSSVPNSLLYYHLVLVSPCLTPPLGWSACSSDTYTINQGGTDPTTVNHFASTGWTQQSTKFAPPSSFWVPGTYTLELVVNMTMPSGQPSDASIHFDDVGLALNLMQAGTGSAYGSRVLTATFDPAISTSQTQSLDLGLNMSTASYDPSQTLTNTIAYVYLGETTVGLLNQPTFTTWQEVASVTFNGSATAQAVISLPYAANFVDGSGEVSIKIVTISVGSGVACQTFPATPYCTLTVSAYVVAQTDDTQVAVQQAVFTITNPEGAAPIQLSSLYITGPNGYVGPGPSYSPADTNGVATFNFPDLWVNAGSTTTVYANMGDQSFWWIPGQVYQVTLIGAAGTSYSASFTAP